MEALSEAEKVLERKEVRDKASRQQCDISKLQFQNVAGQQVKMVCLLGLLLAHRQDLVDFTYFMLHLLRNGYLD